MKIAIIFGIVSSLCLVNASECPPGKVLGQCLIAPCRYAHCDNYPSAVCVDDYCGGCNARFFVGKIEVTSLCGPA
eukprot:Em0004g547a